MKKVFLILTLSIILFTSYELSSATVVDSGKMVYIDDISGGVFDIQGYHDSSLKATSYSDDGYTIVLDINGTPVTVPANYTSGDTFISGDLEFVLDLSFISDDNYVKVEYTVTNTGTSSITYGIGTHADTQIGLNDSAEIQTTDRGIVMLEGTVDDAQFNVILQSSYGVTDVDTYWFGSYSDRQANLFIQTSATTYSGDSGVAYSWKERTLPAGDTITHSVLFGIGPVNEAPIINSNQTGSLGNKVVGDIMTLSGGVSDPESDAISLYYAIDGEDYTNNPVTLDGSNNYSFDLTVPDMELFDHDIELVAVDAKGAISSVKLTYTQVPFTVTVEFNSNTSNIEVAEGSDLSRLIGTVEDGYEITGLFKDSLLTDDWDSNTEVLTGNLSLYASYILVDYNIIYDLDGGINSGTNPATYTTEDNITFGVPTKTGYEFNGWYDNSSFTGTAITEITAGAIGDINLYAEFVVGIYTVQYTDYDASVLQTEDFNYGDDLSGVTPPSEPTRVGYVFNAWDSTLPGTMPDNDITVTATYLLIDYTITYDLDGGTNSLSNPATYTIEDDITFESATKTGYVFSGWYDNELFTGSPVTDISPGETGNINLYAKFDVEVYTVEYIDHEGTVLQTEDFNYEADLTGVTPPSDPTRVGYTFDSWDTTLPSTMPANDITVTATYTINSYTVEYVDHEGTVLQTEDFNYEADLTGVTPPSDPTRVGYTFDSWDTTLPSTMPANDITVTATYTINSYTITFEANGGSLVADITENFGASITPPTEPTREGYTFEGWYTDSALTIPYTFNVISANNITLFAKWIDIELPIITGLESTLIDLSDLDNFTWPVPVVTDNVDTELDAITSYFSSDKTIEFTTLQEFLEELRVNGSGVIKYNSTDSENNNAIEIEIIITVKDDIEPKIDGVEDAANYQKDTELIITFDEGTATLNGKLIDSGTIITEAGSYELIVTDDEGNVTECSFTIDGASYGWVFFIVVPAAGGTLFIFKKQLFGL